MPASAAPLKRTFKLSKMERREVTTDPVTGRKLAHFAGFLAVYSNRDWYDSMLKPGCFTKSLQERQTWPLLADHDPDRPMGRFKVEDRPEGLWIEADVFLDISYAMDKWIALEGGAIDGLSVGFSIVKREYDEEKELLTVLEARLWEGSVVTFPANDLARVEVLRSMGAEAKRALMRLVHAARAIEGELQDELARALGDEPDQVAARRATALLDSMVEQIEALRAGAKLGEAASETAEPAERHSTGEDVVTDEDIDGLAQLVRGIHTK